MLIPIKETHAGLTHQEVVEAMRQLRKRGNEYADNVDQDLSNVLPLARDHDLSASYLDLPLRHSTPLATLDRKPRKAAQKAGAKLFTGRPRCPPIRVTTYFAN